MLWGWKRKKYQKEAGCVFESALIRAKEAFPTLFSEKTTTEKARLNKFEAISVFAILYLTGLQKSVVEEGQKKQFFDAFYSIMYDRFDIALREQGVSDLKVGPKVRALGALFKEALLEYGTAFDENSAKNVMRILQEKELCDAGYAMQLSIQLCAEYQLIKTLSFLTFLEHTQRPKTGMYEPHVLSEKEAVVLE